MQLSAMVGCTDLQQKTGVSLLSPKDFKQNIFFCLIKLNGIWAGKLTYIYIGRISNFQSLVLHIGPITYNVYHRLTLLMLNSV